MESFYLTAFWDLSTERQQGENLGHIPWSAARLYAYEYGLDGDMIHVFWNMVKSLDATFLGYVHGERKKEMDRQKASAKHKTRR